MDRRAYFDHFPGRTGIVYRGSDTCKHWSIIGGNCGEPALRPASVLWASDVAEQEVLERRGHVVSVRIIFE